MDVNDFIAAFQPEMHRVFPGKQFAAVRSDKETMTPVLLGVLQDAIDNYKQFDIVKKGWPSVVAMHLLAEFREPQAHTLVLELCRLPIHIADVFFGDIITETLQDVLASTYDGNEAALKALIENEDVDEWIRVAGLHALFTLTRIGTFTRADLIDYIGTLYRNLDYSHTTVVEFLVYYNMLIHPAEYMDEIRAIFATDAIIFPDFLALDEVEETAAKPQDEVMAAFRENEKEFGLIDSAEPILRGYWEWFGAANHEVVQAPPTEEPTVPKVGRNELCPCGSGRKYKHCHGKKG